MEPEAEENGLVDLDGLGLSHGDATRLDVPVALDEVTLGGQEYRPEPSVPTARVDVSRTTSGYALRLRFDVALGGPCFRCLEPASHRIAVDVREVDQPVESVAAEIPGARPGDQGPDDQEPDPGETELESPYVEGGQLRLSAWARDALILALPNQILCREDCRGLCSWCGENLNGADPADHDHGQNLDPRWAKLRDLG
ncbi:MAG: DUF177 domain-containing protein [Solirubrobacterales bacterium]|nr:DUF177 domain-containing protein [Solirubrobacterales bacterium]